MCALYGVPVLLSTEIAWSEHLAAHKQKFLHIAEEMPLNSVENLQTLAVAGSTATANIEINRPLKKIIHVIDPATHASFWVEVG